MLLEKAALESLMRTYFQRVYGEDEIQEMEEMLKNALEKYPEEDSIFQERLPPGKHQSPETLLTLAKLFMQIGDLRIACEMIWCSATLALQEFVIARELKVKLNSHVGKRRFARALSDDIARDFAVFEGCHSSFYSNRLVADDVDFAFKNANQFMGRLDSVVLTPEKLKRTRCAGVYRFSSYCYSFIQMSCRERRFVRWWIIGIGCSTSN